MTFRDRNLARLDGGNFDVVIVGGGINGAVSAAALAARGATVAVVDRSDFAAVTSQESSNLVWGGFKYLENYELALVAKLCHSRNRLMRAYPNAITPTRFLATLDTSAPFPSWLAALGTVGYWGIGQFATKPPKYYRPRSIKKTEPIINIDTASAAVEYGDAYLKDNDARFVWNFIRSALDHGAVAANYVSVDSATHDQGTWEIEGRDVQTGHRFDFTAKAIVNATGPYIDEVNAKWGVETEHRIVYSKGIHLVVPKLTESERVLAFFDDSQRLFYVIPMAHRSVIGTTDTRTANAEEGVTDDDRYFLLKQINTRLDLDEPLTIDDIVSERCGVRPLVVLNDGDDRTEIDWTSLSRKHEIEVDRETSTVSVFGGKLTDCLNVGGEVVDAIADLGIELGPDNDGWYGEPSSDEQKRFLAAAAAVGFLRRPDVEREDTVADVLWRRHGKAATAIVDAIAGDASLGEPVLAESDLLLAELPLYADRELVVKLEDFLRRRTKVAMIRSAEAIEADPGLAIVRQQLGVA